MIDILVYLFENYLPDACPEPEVLARKLSAAGFGSDDISAALAWLDGLAGPEGGRCSPPALAGSVRIYGEEEQERLSTACRGFIAFLEQNARSTPPCAKPSSSARWPCRMTRLPSTGSRSSSSP
jgi:Smg protein